MKEIIPKTEARKFVYERREAISEREVRRKSLKISENLRLLDEVLSAKNILFYASEIKGDIYTKGMIDLLIGMGKVISLPKLHKSQCRFFRGVFLGWEKTDIGEEGFIESTVAVDDNFDDIDLIIVPSVAVSLDGRRIGIGKEYYSNLISKTLAPRIVLAFEFQVFNKIETTQKEFNVSKIITERRIIPLQYSDNYAKI
jgi:5,10-methenyltetrahydrofolate synthetase